MIISRYLSREVVSTLLVITIILVVAFLSQQMVRYLNFVAIGKIPTSVFLQLVSFEAPYLFALLLPLGLYLGIIFAYGRLYADNEMLVLQMCGYGQRQLIRLTLFVAVFVAVAVLYLMLWVNPWISGKREQAMGNNEVTLHLIETLIPGRFQASPDGRHVMYVEKLSRDRQRAQHVFLAQEKVLPEAQPNGQRAWTLVVAKEGYQEKDKESADQFFVTTDGYRYEGIPGQNDYKIIQFKKYNVRIPQPEVKANHTEVESMSTAELWRDYKNPESAAELQWRVSLAISALLLALLAVPLSSVRPRRGRYLTLLPAILIYIVYVNFLIIARRWTEEGSISIYLGMWWVHVLMLILVLAVLFYNKRQWK